jgi:hypothetical protein
LAIDFGLLVLVFILPWKLTAALGILAALAYNFYGELILIGLILDSLQRDERLFGLPFYLSAAVFILIVNYLRKKINFKSF